MSTATQDPDAKQEHKSEETRAPTWWKRPLAWIIGVPLLLVLAGAGLFAWGAAQPRPEGFSVAEPPLQTEPPAGAELSEEPTSPAPPEISLYTLDARDTEIFVLFDFETGAVVQGDLTSSDWDLAFRRTKLLTNSGVTNPSGDGGAVDLGEIDIEDAVVPENPQFTVDTLGGEDGDEALNEAAGRWYSYSFITHIVSVKPNTYLLRTGGSMDALVQFESYYCADEEPGCITFRYLLVPASTG